MAFRTRLGVLLAPMIKERVGIGVVLFPLLVLLARGICVPLNLALAAKGKLARVRRTH